MCPSSAEVYGADQLKHDFINLCQAMNTSPFGLIGIKFYMQHNFINTAWLQKYQIKSKSTIQFGSNNYILELLAYSVVVDGEFLLE